MIKNLPKLDKPENKNSQYEYWNSPEMLTFFSVEPFLFRGERLAFRSCFPNGLVKRRVLDLGCGTGRIAHFLYKMDADVVGVDTSLGMIRIAQQQHPHIDFCLGDAESLPFKEGTFDFIVFAFNGLDYLYPKYRRLKAICEISRVLCQGGFFIFSHHNLAGLLFGWYKFLGPKKLLFRVREIINGNVFKSDCYLRDVGAPEIMTYYAWPKQIIADLRQTGFELISIYPDSLLTEIVQRILRINWLAKWTDPWPYYIFRKSIRSL